MDATILWDNPTASAYFTKGMFQNVARQPTGSTKLKQDLILATGYKSGCCAYDYAALSTLNQRIITLFRQYNTALRSKECANAFAAFDKPHPTKVTDRLTHLGAHRRRYGRRYRRRTIVYPWLLTI